MTLSIDNFYQLNDIGVSDGIHASSEGIAHSHTGAQDDCQMFVKVQDD